MTWRNWGNIVAIASLMFPLFRIISCHSEFLSVYLQRYKILLFRKDSII